MSLNRWGLAGTVVTALLALDTAYETLRAASDERWWVAALALVIVGVQVFLLSRQRAGAAAWCGVIGLLLFPLGGLWLSSIADRGVVMLGVETRGLAVIAVALGVALAAIAIATVPRMPRAAQAVIALLALYAIAAYGLGLRQQAHLVDIVGGVSLWSRLPYWLQGGFIGAAVLLPAALLIIISRGVAALGRRDGQHWSLQAVAMLLCLLMVAPAFGLVARRQSGGDTAVSAPTALPLPQAAESPGPPAEISALPPRELIPTDGPLRRVGEAQKRLPSLRYDRSGRAGTLAGGHDASFHFVRDHVGFDAYQGVLRGAVGAYLTRSGNAWDRALLLADFLRDKGVIARLARGTLDGATAERLYARLFTPPGAAPGDVAEAVPATGENITLQRIRERADRDYRAVMSAYGNTLSVIGARAAREQALNELRDHVWVQAEVDGAWMDLDPSFQDSQAGQRLTEVTETFAAPPETAFQKVTIRVIAETVEGTATQEREVLSATRHAVDVLGRRIILGHAPGQGASGPAGLAGRISGEAWTPLLWMDGEIAPGQPIRFGSGSDATEPLGRRGPELFAEWLEVITERPDGTRDASRRALVDRGGAAARAAGQVDVSQLAKLPRNHIGTIAPQMLHAIWLTAGQHHLLDYTEAVAELIAAAERKQPLPDHEDLLWAIGVETFSIVAWSEHVLMPAANADAHVRVFADSPRAIVVSLGPDGRDPKRPLVEYDLLRDRVRSLPRDASAEKAAVDRRVWFGMLEGALEHELGATSVAATGGRPDDIVSTSGLLGSAGVVAVPPNQQPQLLAAAKSEDVAARMRPALDRGAAVVIPMSGDAPPRGWWEVDTDGTTRAVLASGLAGTRYTPGGDGADRTLPLSPELRPGPGGGSGAWINARGDEMGRMANGEWHRYARRPNPGAGANEHANLLGLVAGTASAWSIVAMEIAALAITASHAVASLPTESSP